MMNFFDVRPADAAGGDSQQDFSRSDFGYRDILHSHLARPTIDARAHAPGRARRPGRHGGITRGFDRETAHTRSAPTVAARAFRCSARAAM